jgi:hypothetical protein
MPSVTPIPSTVICASVIVSGSGPSGPGMRPEDDAGGDDDEVVEHRRPHRRPEPPAGVEVAPHDRAGAVEQDLRQQEAGEDHREVAGRGVQLVAVQPTTSGAATTSRTDAPPRTRTTRVSRRWA